LESGTVRILVQSPLLNKNWPQLFGDVVTIAPKFIIPSSNTDDDGVEVKPLPWQEVQVQHSLTDLGRPDGSTGGFYSLMRRTRFIRLEIVKRLLHDDDTLSAEPAAFFCLPLKNALSGLRSVPRPPWWRHGDDNNFHVLEADATTRVGVLLAYEKNELVRDITFIEGKFSMQKGQVLGGNDIPVEMDTMTLEQAKVVCLTLPGCRGFTYQGEPTEGAVKIHFKDAGELQPAPAWTSYCYQDGEAALLELLEVQHDQQFRGDNPTSDWVEPEVPPWQTLVDRAAQTVQAVCQVSEDGERRLSNFITDRDGTINNYCDRYASSVQSAYNATWLSLFAKSCTDNAVIVTAAPLGGRPSAEGLLELSVAPRGVFTYTGSKGREYFDQNAQRVLEADELPDKQRETVEELHRRILSLCAQPGNTKFLGIGSGLQRKFGEVTMARNDPAGTVPEPESKRFMAAVRQVKEELDPDGTELDLHDTGTDMEIFPRMMATRAPFDKGNGVRCLDRKLHLHIADGHNLVCGDTSSDVAMIEAVLRMMCGDKMVDMWLREDDPEKSPDEDSFNFKEGQWESTRQPSSDVLHSELTEEEMMQRIKDEEEQKARDLEEEELARKAGSKLAVLFVIPPKLHKRSPQLAKQVQRLCELSGAHCAILPSPDVLVAALLKCARQAVQAEAKIEDSDAASDTQIPTCNARL